MRTLAILAVTGLLLAGCAGTGDLPESTTTSKSLTSKAATTEPTTTKATGTTGPTASNSPTTSQSVPNQPPTATLAASVAAGNLPLNVTFTLKGADADADALTYTFDVNGATPAEQTGNGTALPVTFVFQYTAAGNYTATLTVSDGKNSTSAHAAIAVLASGNKATEILAGHIYAPDPVMVAEGECLFAIVAQFADILGVPAGGVAGDYHHLETAQGGWSYAFDVAGMVVQFGNGAGGYVGDSGSEGTVPPAALDALVCADSAVNTDYSLTMTEP